LYSIRDDFLPVIQLISANFLLKRNCRKLLNTVRTGQKWTIWKGV